MKLGIINSAFGQAGVDTKTGLEHIARIIEPLLLVTPPNFPPGGLGDGLEYLRLLTAIQDGPTGHATRLPLFETFKVQQRPHLRIVIGHGEQELAKSGNRGSTVVLQHGEVTVVELFGLFDNTRRAGR